MIKEGYPARYTVTAALPYANGPLHIGHLAGVYVPADIYVRYLRSAGKEVAFICGSDEHGVPITLKARAEGTTPQKVVDRYHSLIHQSFQKLGISFDVYSRTSADIHHQTASSIFKTLYDKGKLKEKEGEQFYDPIEKQFLADRYITGSCPHCGYDKAYGDQCESCGTSLSPHDLINPVSRLSGQKPEKRISKHWYLPLNEYEPWLKEWILKEHKSDWKTNVYGQCKSWIDSGLNPRAVTRDLNWGVKVPLKNEEGKVLYVWFEAPIGYISATKELTKNWEKYWKDQNTKLVHFIGKDNIVFHCIIFPAILKAEGSYILPENVPANEFLNLEGEKISTSRNWAVWLHEYLEDLPDKQDTLRYVLTANAPETKDNDFSWKDFQARHNNELVAIYGNFVHRAMVLTNKYYEGTVPAPENLTDEDKIVLDKVLKAPEKIAQCIEKYHFRQGLQEMMKLARTGNKYLADNEPWKIIKTDPERVKAIMHTCLQIAAQLAYASSPFLPDTSRKLQTMMNLPEKPWTLLTQQLPLKEGHQLNKPTHLFQQIDDKAINHQYEKLAKRKEDNNRMEQELEPEKEAIDFEEFTRSDLRTATVLNAEKVPKTGKLLKVELDTGLDKRTVVAGIAQWYNPEDLTGKKVVVVTNLKPRKIKGIESKGMILMANNPDGKLVLVSPGKDAENGAAIN